MRASSSRICAGKVALDVPDLKPQALVTQAVPQPFVVTLPSANLHVEARTDGRASIDATFSGDIPSLQVARGERHLELAATSFKGNALLTASAERGQAQRDSPGRDRRRSVRQACVWHVARQRASWTFGFLRWSSPKLRDAALAIAGDDALVREYARRVNGGVVTDLHFGAKANTLDELFVLQNMAGSVTLAEGSFMVPEIEREATDLSGKFELRDGKLSGSGVSARLGTVTRLRRQPRNTLSPPATRPSAPDSTWSCSRRWTSCAGCCRSRIASRSPRCARSPAALRDAPA